MRETRVWRGVLLATMLGLIGWLLLLLAALTLLASPLHAGAWVTPCDEELQEREVCDPSWDGEPGKVYTFWMPDSEWPRFEVTILEQSGATYNAELECSQAAIDIGQCAVLGEKYPNPHPQHRLVWLLVDRTFKLWTKNHETPAPLVTGADKKP